MATALGIKCPDRIYNDVAWDRKNNAPVSFPVAGKAVDTKSRADARNLAKAAATAAATPVVPSNAGGGNGPASGRGRGGRGERGGARSFLAYIKQYHKKSHNTYSSTHYSCLFVRSGGDEVNSPGSSRHRCSSRKLY